jgi:hypothetical protein
MMAGTAFVLMRRLRDIDWSILITGSIKLDQDRDGPGRHNALVEGPERASL